MNTKPKLLISLGCSFTAGSGCYSDESIEWYNSNKDKINHDELNRTLLHKNRKRFREEGWPFLLSKKLKFNKLINMGIGGSSTSGQLKRFFKNYHVFELEKYDTTIIWLLTDSVRFSKYINGEVEDISINGKNESIANSYHRLATNIDYTLEQIFTIRCMIEFCKSHNINLYFDSWHTDTKNDISNTCKKDDSLKYILNYYLDIGGIDLIHHTDGYISRICDHPNQEGYKEMARLLYEKLITIDSHILGNSDNTENTIVRARGDVIPINYM